MKTTFLTGLSLTLFMLLLVMFAAFWFLYQGQQTLQAQVDRATQEAQNLQADLDQSRSELFAAEATRQITAEAVATAESDSLLLEGQLVESQQNVNDLTTTVDTLTADLTSARENLTQLAEQQDADKQRRPTIQFVAPEAEAVLLLGDPIELIVVAADPTGIAGISLTLGQEPLQSYTVGGETLYTARKVWQPKDAGSYIINAVATSSLGRVSSLITTTVEVIDREARSLEILAQVEDRVTEIRGLASDQPGEVVFSTSGQAEAPAASLSVIAAPSGWQPEALTLSSFDLLPPGTNLPQTRALLQSQLGLTGHDPAQPEQIHTQQDGQLDPAAVGSHVHQFVHTLQAQHHSLDFAALNALDFDARLAFYGLVEGEAALVEALYLEQGYLSAEQAAQITGSASQAAADVLQALPPYLVNEYAFPSGAGKSFVTSLYEQGQDSFAQIDAAWQDPPTSTEQILHPDRYLSGDTPLPVALPLSADALGPGWSLVEEGRLGEFFLRQYLGQQLNESQVEMAATGWGGDHFALYQNEELGQVTMVLRLLWDTVEDSGEFAAIYPNYPTRLYNVSGELQSYGAECWQGNDVICLYHAADETYIWRVPDIDTADIIAQELELGQEG